MNNDLINLARQCCDADAYLSLGYRCAQTNSCYDELRPVGDALWFSLPYRLGLDESFLFYMQLGLLACVLISLFALLRQPNQRINISKILLFGLACSTLVWQLLPTFFNSLADTPATLLLCAGMLLIIIASRQQHAGLFFLAGLALGCSALLRAAYFNPLSAAGMVLLLAWLWQTLVRKNKQYWKTIFVMSFCLPLSLQFYASWKNMQEWSFLSGQQTKTQLADHLNSAVVGYDTLLIESSYYWAPPCRPSRGVFTGIMEHDWSGLNCLLSNRFYFYFGSYGINTFTGPDNKNFISNGFAENVGDVLTWSHYNINIEPRAALSPLGDKRASYLSTAARNNKDIAFVESTSLTPLQAGNYRYSIWLWTKPKPTDTILDIQFLQKTLDKNTLDWKRSILKQEKITLSERPTQFYFDINNPSLSYLSTRAGFMEIIPTNTSNTPETDFFAWGAMLETASTKTGYVRSTQKLFSPIGSAPTVSGHDRFFSGILLFINVVIVLIAGIWLVKTGFSRRCPTLIFIASLLLMILIESMLILPEQRFLQGFFSCCCLLTILFLHEAIATTPSRIAMQKT